MPRSGNPYDHSWQKLRKRFLRAFPRCRICGERANAVDHIVTVRRAPERRLDWTNLQSLCERCHNRLTDAFDRPAKGGCDASGHSLDRGHPWSKMGDRVGVRAQGKQDWVRDAIADLKSPPRATWRREE